MKTIITIGRQFGSAGREIGEKLAKEFDIPCYDKELLTRAAKESGFCEELIQTHDERPTNSFLYNLVMDTYSFGYNAAGLIDMPISQKVFLAQFDAIKKMADEGPCIIVGRCADYALANNPDVINIFVRAELEDRVKLISKRMDLTENKAKDLVLKNDKQRASYYNYYTSKKWGDTSSYDLTINTSKISVDNAVDLILDFRRYMDAKQGNGIV